MNFLRFNPSGNKRPIDWSAIQTQNGLPAAPGEVLDARWIAARDDWYVQTKEGWYWLQDRTWVRVPLGPL